MKPTTLNQHIRIEPVSNASGEDIPPFAAMRVTGVDSDGLFTVNKPDTDNQTSRIFFNGPVTIVTGGYGNGTPTLPVTALYDSADGTPAAGDEWGVQSGTWKLKNAQTGFIIMGGVNTSGTFAIVGSAQIVSSSGSLSYAENESSISAYSVTGEDTWNDTGFETDSISAGTYLIFANVTGNVQMDTGGGSGVMYAKLWDTVNDVPLDYGSGTSVVAQASDPFNNPSYGTASLVGFHTSASSFKVGILSLRKSPGFSGTWLVSDIFSPSSGNASLADIIVLSV